VILKHRALILGFVFCISALSIAYSLMKPDIFTATARILPPQESNPALQGLFSQVGGTFGELASRFVGRKSSSDVYLGILRSRTVADKLVKNFDLKELYEKEYLTSVYKRLTERTNMEVSKENGIISVSVDDEDPERAADMANTYVEALDEINREVNITEGYRKRIFLEKRLRKVKEDFMKAEADLKGFQEQHKIISIADQARVAIEGAAAIKGEIIAAQTELEVLKQFGTEMQNEAVTLKSKIAELEKQLASIEDGSQTEASLYIPFKKMPAIGMKFARLMREAKIQEEVFKLLTTQYELAKIEEAKDVKTIQVLDWAVPPDRKSAPRRSFIVISATAASFFLAVFLAFFLEFVERLKTEDHSRYQQVVQGLKLRRNRERPG
jgi:uncharacterized protein involved in exopolysaccharide biosynthesis